MRHIPKLTALPLTKSKKIKKSSIGNLIVEYPFKSRPWLFEIKPLSQTHEMNNSYEGDEKLMLTFPSPHKIANVDMSTKTTTTMIFLNN